ncbi:MAG: pilus assembly protein PilM [Candidatus Omnitrophota bacterium]
MNFDFAMKFGRKPSSIVVVDISSGLKLSGISIKDNKVNALKEYEFPVAAQKDEFILKSLQNFLKESSGQDKEAVLIPSSGSYLIKRLQLPAVPKQELSQSIRWQIKEGVSFDNSKASLDFKIIKKITKEDGSEVFDIIVAVADNDKLISEVNIIKQAGLSCVAVIPAAAAYTGILSKYNSGQGKAGPVAILELQDDGCFIATYRDGQLDFYRELPVSISKLKQLLLATLITESGQAQLSGEQINKVLFEEGIPLEGSPYKDKAMAGQIVSLLRPGLERLAQEIKRSLLYYDSQYQGGQVEKIFVCGKGSRIINLDKFLAAQISLPVVMSLFMDKVNAAASIRKEQLIDSCGDISAASSYIDSLNILPTEFRSEKIETFQKVSLRWIAGIIFLMLLVSFIFASGTTAVYQKRLDNSLVHLQVISQVKNLKGRLDSFKNFISGLRDTDVEVGKVLKRFSIIAPADLFFDELNINCDAKTGALTGHITNIVNPDAILAKLVDGMVSTAYFKDVNIASMEQTEMGAKAVSKFQVDFKLQ